LHVYLFSICAVLTVFLYFKGGATNPFVSLYLVPIAISAASLSMRFTIPLTVSCLLAYSGLMFYYQPLQLLSPHHEMILHSEQHSMRMTESSDVNWHVIGMWLNFGISALLITWFVTRMASALRVRDAELSAIREKRLRDEQLLGIATLAAGTVHELGTPLSTMAVLTEDLKYATKDNPDLAADVHLLAEQVLRCKLIVQNLARAAEQPSNTPQRVALNDYLIETLTHWQLLQPQVSLKKELLTNDQWILADTTLKQALINLLNNAVEASPAGIELYVAESKSAKQVSIRIRDHGAGVQLDANKVGKPFASTRGPGRGLGLFVSNAAIERLGGQVTLGRHPQGGTLTTVTLPCL